MLAVILLPCVVTGSQCKTRNRGVARIFQRWGHRGYSLLLSLVYQRAQSYYRGMRSILTKDKSR